MTGSADSLPLSIAHLVRIDLVHNSGISFGRLAEGGVAVVLVVGLVTACVAAALLVAARRYHTAIALILAGSLGNLVDRVRFGYVVDFIDAPYWPTFNIADIAIVLGAALLSWRLLTIAPADTGAASATSLSGPPAESGE